ncbi:MAG: hypothetical protein JO232_15005 [Verrucomicrobia bacterium]|nr:hypothetical protein [Verrucomicrobiota bacterium]
MNNFAVSIREYGTYVSGNGVGVAAGDGEIVGAGVGGFGFGHAAKRNVKTNAGPTLFAKRQRERLRMYLASQHRSEIRTDP